MLLEILFGSTFGLIWLIVFLVAILALIVWLFIKKEKDLENSNEKEEIINEKEEANVIEKEEIVEVKEEIKENVNNEYEILESDDGFFRVRKIGSERTLRKFATKMEAEDFVEKRGLKHD